MDDIAHRDQTRKRVFSRWHLAHFSLAFSTPKSHIVGNLRERTRDLADTCSPIWRTGRRHPEDSWKGSLSWSVDYKRMSSRKRYLVRLDRENIELPIARRFKKRRMSRIPRETTG